MAEKKRIGKLEYQFSKEKGLAWRFGEGNVHRIGGKKQPDEYDPYGEDGSQEPYAGDAYGEQYDQGYDYESRQGYAQDDGYAYADAEQPYGEENYADAPSGPLRFLYEAEWVMWVLLILLPPLGIWLLWKRERYDIILRSVISIASLIWLVIAIIFLAGGFSASGADTTQKLPSNITYTPAPSPTLDAGALTNPDATTAATPILSTPSPTPATGITVPTSTPLAGGASNPSVGNTADEDANATVYATSSGKFYHNIKLCTASGMTQEGRPYSLEAAKLAGKTACTFCIGAADATSGTYYYNDDGKYYHKASTCTNMPNPAPAHTYADTIASKKPACPVCIGYYAVPDGNWYHVDPKCQTMTGAKLYTMAEINAFAKKHTACPVCIGGASSASAAPKEVTSLSDYVYATKDGKYYHTNSSCSKMKNAVRLTVQQAIQYGKKACPECVIVKAESVKVETDPTKLTNDSNVYARGDAAYFHIKEDCPEIKDKKTYVVTVKFAREKGLATCPICIAAPLQSPGTAQDAYTASDVNWYSAAGDSYFHVKSKCSEATGTLAKAATSVISQRGQKPCPVCIGLTKVQNVFATSGGKYYHLSNDCAAAGNAYEVSLYKALANDKAPCPDCVLTAATPGPTAKPTTYVYLDVDGVYHKKSSCSDVASSTVKTALDVAVARFTPCETCGAPKEVEKEEKPTNATTSVYVTFENIENNEYYHKSSSCPDVGMSSSDSTKVTLEWALKYDYKRCPKCSPPRSYE